MKLTFDQVMERIADDRPVQRSDVQAAALRRKIWWAEWHIPGCLSESGGACLTKADAIEYLLACAADEDGAPRGMATSLRKRNSFLSESPMYGTCINTVARLTLADII